jgi:hypothetical protein
VAICGCGASLDGAPNDLIAAGAGITLDGTFQNPGTTVSATAALAWIPFTPVIYGFTIGNGIVRARYRQDGSTINVVFRVRLGTTSTYSGEFAFDLPSPTAYNPVATTILTGGGIAIGHPIYGAVSIIDNSTTTRYKGKPFIANAGAGAGGHFKCRMGDDLAGIANTNNVAQGNPITFATDDEIVVSATVEISI